MVYLFAVKRWLGYCLLLAIAFAVLVSIPFGIRHYGPIEKNNRAVEALEQQQYDRAIALLNEAAEGAPDNEIIRRNLVAAYNSKAVDLEKQGSDLAAADWYEKALALDPSNQTILRNYAATLNNLAVGYSNSRRFTESQALFERAGRWLPKISEPKVRADVLHNYSALLTLWGAELMKANQPAEARRAFKQALSLEPKNSVANIYLGDLYYEVNEYDQAKTFYTAALEDARPENREYIEGRLAMIRDEARLEPNFRHETDPEGRFNISYVPYSGGVPVPELFVILAEARETIGRKLGVYPARAVNVKIYNTRDFYTVSRVPLWAIGIFDGKMRLKVDDIQSARSQVRDLLFHEYTHAVIAMNVKQELPAWFHEGMAQLMEPSFAENPREQARMRDALAARPLDFNALKESFKDFDSKTDAETAYLLSKYFLVHLNRTHGDDKLVQWIARLTKEEDFASAFEAVYGTPLARAQDVWIRTQGARATAQP